MIETESYKITDDLVRMKEITLCVGKQSLVNIINEYISEDIDPQYHSRLNDFIDELGGNYDTDSFSIFHNEIFIMLFSNANLINNRMISTNDNYNFHSHIIKYIEQILPLFENDIENNFTHHFLDIKAHRVFNSKEIIDDNSLVEFNNIFFKSHFDKYFKYSNRNENGATAWVYQVSTLFIILLEIMYRILEPLAKNDILQFLIVCLNEIHPVIVGIIGTASYKLEGMNFAEIIYELLQLHSTGEHFIITQNSNVPSVEFTYTTLDGKFTDVMNIEGTYKPHFVSLHYRTDNSGKRYASMKIHGCGNILNLDFSLIGLGVIDEATGMAVDYELFGEFYDEVSMFEIGYKILATMLKHTLEGQNRLKNIIPDFKSEAIKYLVETYKLNQNAVSYAVVACELANKTEDEVNIELEKYFKTTDTKQKQVIKSMVSDVKVIKNFKQKSLLKYIYKVFNHSCGVD